MIRTALVRFFTRPTFPFAAGSRPLLTPHFYLDFAFFFKVFSHFLTCHSFLRTPSRFDPFLTLFQGGVRKTVLHFRLYPILPIWQGFFVKNPRMNANGHEE